MSSNKRKNRNASEAMPSVGKRIKMLVERLNASDTDTFNNALLDYPGRAKMSNSKKGRYVFIDNGASILAVAHVDTVTAYAQNWAGDWKDNYVQGEDKIWRAIPGKVTQSDVSNNIKVNGKWVNSIKLDDRLGIHLILDVLPMLGINVDVLLTDDEEMAMSTASEFVLPDGKVYNWAFSFDRRGVGECVMYQYDRDKKAAKLLDKAGWYLGRGSYSDIADLNINCVCYNFAAGYWDEHTSRCTCHYDNVMLTARMFKRFWNMNKDTRLPFTQVASSRYWGRGYYSDYAGDKWERKTYQTGGKGNAKDKKDDYIPSIVPSEGVECWYCGNQATFYTSNYTPLCNACTDSKGWQDEYKDEGTEEISVFDQDITCVYCGQAQATRWDIEDDPDHNPVCDDCYLLYSDESNQNTGKQEIEHAWICDQCGQVTPDDELDDEFISTCQDCADWMRRNFHKDELDYARSVNNPNLLTAGNGG